MTVYVVLGRNMLTETLPDSLDLRDMRIFECKENAVRYGEYLVEDIGCDFYEIIETELE